MKAGAHPLRGYLYIGGAALFWGIAATLGRATFTGRLLPGGALRVIDPLILSQSRATVSLAVLLPVLLLRRGAAALRVPGRDLVRFLLIGVFGVAASNYLYYLAKRGGGTRGGGMCSGRRLCGIGRAASGWAGRDRGDAGGVFVRVLQRWRTQRAREV
ncbi:MAG: EamA family transporter [Candidatus Koribacter versatilis]|nr:EamA family transporter [Candidatus Koribacter versatilis]